MWKRSVLLVAIVLAALALGLWLRLTGSGRETAYVTVTADIMAAPISVMAPEPVAEEAAEIVFSVFRDVDVTMSEWKPASPLSEVNQAAGRDAVAVGDDLRALIHRSIEIGERTDGAFDITWAALWGLWDFTAEQPAIPDDDAIEHAVAHVDFRRIVIDDEAGTVLLPDEEMLIGLGGIAKGHALDVAAEALRSRGIHDFLISAGGQMMPGGTRGDRPWRIGIRDPRGGPQDYIASLELSDVSISTSGDYERFFVRDGVRYHHILDPRTGRPSRGVRSVSIVCADATLADALSTSLMILGVERGLAVAESWDGVEALLIDDERTVHVTSGLVGRVRPHGEP